MFCTNCGNKVEEGYKFCVNCGFLLGNSGLGIKEYNTVILEEKINFINKKTYNILGVLVWFGLVATLILTFYVNHYMPHGPSYPTGDVVCQYDSRGSCGEEYVEDTSNLNIPAWAKFLRRYFLLVIITEGALATYLQIKGGKEFRE